MSWLPMETFSRRKLLGIAAVGGIGALVTACGGGAPAAPTTAPAAPAAPPPTQAPAATAAPAAKPTGASSAAAPAAATPAGTPQTFVGKGIGSGTATPVSRGTALTADKYPVKATSPTKIVLWQYNGFHQPIQKKLGDEYQKLMDPNVSLEITAFPSVDQQKSAVRAALAGGSGPDIVAHEPGGDSVDYIVHKTLTPWNNQFKSDPHYHDGFWPNALALMTVNGLTSGVPVATNTVLVYYNKKIFSEVGVDVPKTVDDLKAMAPKIAAKNYIPMAYPAGQDRNQPVFAFYIACGSLGVDGLMRQADLGKAAWTDPKLVEAATMVDELAKAKLFGQGVLSEKEPDVIQLLASGKAAMAFCGSWLRSSIRQALPKDFELDIFPFPAYKSGKSNVLSSDGTTMGVNANSKNQDLAFQMAKWFTGDRGKVEYQAYLGIAPNGPISDADLKTIQDALKDPLYAKFLQYQPTGTTRILFTPQVQEAAAQAMSAILNQQMPVQQAMASIEAASKSAGSRDFTVGG